MSDKHRKAASAARLAKDKMSCNKPRRTPGHPTKSHVVKACKGGEEKIVRFGQQGVEGAGKNPTTESILSREMKLHEINERCIKSVNMEPKNKRLNRPTH